MFTEAALIACRYAMIAGAVVAALVVLMTGGQARAQALTVLPVSIQMAPGQMAATLTVINGGQRDRGPDPRLYLESAKRQRSTYQF